MSTTPPDLDADEIFTDRDPMAPPEPTPAPETAVPIQHISDVMQDVVAALNAGRPKTIATPFYTINNLLDGGLRPGELIFLGARPGIGKTALALEIARHAAKHTPVLVVSREMVNAALARRLVCQDGRVPASDLRRHVLSEDDLVRFGQSWERLSALDLWLTDAAISLKHVRAIVDKPPEKVTAWGLVIVDYLQLVRPPQGIPDRRLQVEAVSQGLKEMALVCKVPVLCLTSLRRPQAPGARPTMGDLKESGELEHDADVIILMHRDDKPGEDPNTIVEMHICKNRDGETGLRDLVFTPKFVSFASRDYERNV